MSITKVQHFEARTIRRKDIQEHPFNPRFITDENKKRLRKNLKEVGLVETLVWNERSKRLVSGHQRLSIIDAMEGNDDYEITVAVVDMDDATERKMVVFLNNKDAQGDFDADGLNRIMEGLSWDDAGFSLEMQAVLENISIEDDPDDAQDIADDLRSVKKKANLFDTGSDDPDEDEEDYVPAEGEKSWKEKRQDHIESARSQNSEMSYLTLYFDTQEEADDFRTRYGIDTGMASLSGAVFAKMIVAKHGPPKQ